MAAKRLFSVTVELKGPEGSTADSSVARAGMTRTESEELFRFLSAAFRTWAPSKGKEAQAPGG
jgi:hypothetical protein